MAIFLLRTFGEKQFPGIRSAQVAIGATLPHAMSFDTLVETGVLPIDLGGSIFDHHGSDKCVSEVVAKHLRVDRDLALSKLIAYARRDDKEGKGIISRDPIDRALGLSGLIASLNKVHPDDPNHVVYAVLPLLEAHYAAAREHFVELPQEVQQKKQTGLYSETTVRQGGADLRVVLVVSDKPSMPTFLRSQQGPRADVVVQKSESSDHVCILTQQKRGVDLADVAALIRLRESELSGVRVSTDRDYLSRTGRVDELPQWYFDPATNSLLNGGVHNKQVQATKIPWDEMKQIVVKGLALK